MIVVATPTRESFSAGYTYDLIQLVKHNPEVELAVAKGTMLCNQRTKLVKAAFPTVASHVLFIDSDMRFPPDALERLLKRDKDIVAANYQQRATGQPTANKNGKWVKSSNKKGLTEVDYVGFGFILIKKNVFFNVPEPWFATPWDGEKFVGEDTFFCFKAREHGYKIYVDNDLSKDIAHEGIKEYGIK